MNDWVTQKDGNVDSGLWHGTPYIKHENLTEHLFLFFWAAKNVIKMKLVKNVIAISIY